MHLASLVKHIVIALSYFILSHLSTRFSADLLPNDVHIGRTGIINTQMAINLQIVGTAWL